MDKLDRLIEILCNERNEKVPLLTGKEEKKKLFRALVNLRMPIAISEEFLKIQDEYLQEELYCEGISDLSELTPIYNDIYLWKGDITTLRCDAIVNAANSQMLGCFYPNHTCIDNAIHTFSGVQLRLECFEIMKKLGKTELTGKAIITGSYNLPSKYIIHTVGPVVCGKLTKEDEKQLSSCYKSCLCLADKKGLQSIAFCCISTGEFHFPPERAARVAIETVKEYKKQTQSKIKVIFNVFKDNDYEIYKRLLSISK